MEIKDADGKPMYEKWVDISSEKWRRYVFPLGKVLIRNPLKFRISNNGHRILDAQGVVHYIPTGWIALSWEPCEGNAWSEDVSKEPQKTISYEEALNRIWR